MRQADAASRLVEAAVEGRLPRGIGVATDCAMRRPSGRFNLRGSGWLTLKSPRSGRSSVQNVGSGRFHFSSGEARSMKRLALGSEGS
jgi:hypothetical protein